MCRQYVAWIHELDVQINRGRIAGAMQVGIGMMTSRKLVGDPVAEFAKDVERSRQVLRPNQQVYVAQHADARAGVQLAEKRGATLEQHGFDAAFAERCEELGIGEGHVTLTDEAGLVVAVAVLMRSQERAAP